MRTVLRRVGLIGLSLPLLAAFSLPTPAQSSPKTLEISEYKLSAEKLDALRSRFFDQIEAKYPAGSWAPMRMELGDAELALMGLPNKATLLANRYAKPTTFEMAKGGNGGGGGGGSTEPQPQASEGVATVAGAGFFGIRPGALILLINDDSIGWCSAAHVFGSPGSYSISTAGHCGKTGDIATMVGVVGNNTPVLIDFGKFAQSVDGGLGNDYAFISIFPEYQHLVTPTMAFWGGPRGVYTTEGDLATVTFPRNGLVPSVTLDPNPALAQQIVHYGHGTAVGTGGTPRSATAISWRATQFMFFGAISPGDSGSGSNTLLGDAPGDNMEAAGINTHLYVDPLMRQGLGIMGGTRTSAIGTPANGQIVPYPVPAPTLP